MIKKMKSISLSFILVLGSIVLYSQNFWNRIDNFPDYLTTTSVMVDNLGSIYASSWNNQYDAGGVYRSDDDGLTWHRKNNGFIYPNQHMLSLAQDTKGTIYAGGVSMIFKSIDQGESWNLTYQEHEYAINFNTTRCGYDSIILSGGEYNTGIVRSGDNGNTWKPVLDVTHYDYLEAITDIQFGPNNIIYASSRIMMTDLPGIVYSSNDLGNTWEVFCYGATPDIMSLAFDNQGRLIRGEGAVGIYRYDFNNMSWTHIQLFHNSPNDILVVPNDSIFIACAYEYPNNDGVLISHDGGETYSYNNTGLFPSGNDVTKFATDTFGRILLLDESALFRSENIIFTGLQNPKEVSPEYSIYPNPFDKYVNIVTLSNQKREMVDISILNVAGDCVYHVNTFWGAYIKWEPADLPKGLYIVKIVCNNSMSNIKLLKY
jgi:photosystem II stability/assembly factor-like uncharacterized protein